MNKSKEGEPEIDSFIHHNFDIDTDTCKLICIKTTYGDECKHEVVEIPYSEYTSNSVQNVEVFIYQL